MSQGQYSKFTPEKNPYGPYPTQNSRVDTNDCLIHFPPKTN